MFVGKLNTLRADLPPEHAMSKGIQPKCGVRPPLVSDKARSNRIVTFVTNAKLCSIKDLAHEEQ